MQSPTSSQAATPPKPAGIDQPSRGLSFWLIFLAICLTLFLAALELTAVSTALPTIVNELHGRDFVWVGSAYALTSTAILPMTAGLAQIFGRRPSVLGSIILFALGSAISGAAQNIDMLIAGRAIQGIGCGGVLSLSQIVLGDMVSLQERGMYGGLFGLQVQSHVYESVYLTIEGRTWSVACAIGPIVGGSLSSRGQWRWIFYLNLPLCGVSGALVILFLRLPTPPGTLQEKLARLDWIGNFIVIASSCSWAIALTQGGINAPWQSARILTPLILGVLGMGVFIAYEAIWAKYPLVSGSSLILSTPFFSDSDLKFIGPFLPVVQSHKFEWTFFLPTVTIALIYYLPVYFQACKDASPIRAGVLMLGLAASVAPSAILGGISVRVFSCYRTQIWIGWCLMVIGVALFTMIDSDTSLATVVGFSVVFGVRAGINYAVQVFPIQAPLPVTANAHALAFYAFVRSFAGIWAITIGGAILQNELRGRLPPAFTTEFPKGVAIAYAIVPQIPNLPPPVKDQVRRAFADSLTVVWEVLVGITGVGLLSTFLMKNWPLHVHTDEAWALQEKPQEKQRKPDMEIGRLTSVSN